MKASTATELTCTESLKLLADFWSLRIIESLAHGTLRYCEIQRAVDNVNPTTLSKKLHILEEAKLLARIEDQEGLAVSYELTKLGKNALPVLSAVQKFAKQAAR